MSTRCIFQDCRYLRAPPLEAPVACFPAQHPSGSLSLSLCVYIYIYSQTSIYRTSFYRTSRLNEVGACGQSVPIQYKSHSVYRTLARSKFRPTGQTTTINRGQTVYHPTVAAAYIDSHSLACRPNNSGFLGVFLGGYIEKL